MIDCSDIDSKILPIKKCKCCDKKVIILTNDLCKNLSCQGPAGQKGSMGDIGPAGPSGGSAIQIGVEFLRTNNGTTTSPFSFLGLERIWTSNGLINPTGPNFNPVPLVWYPSGSTISYINVVRGATGVPDYFTCSKDIRLLRFYTQIQFSTPSTRSWRTLLYLNGISQHFTWGAPSNNTNNNRTFGVLEYGGIPAGTQVSVRLQGLDQPNSIQNANSYFVIEYQI